jgi:cation transport ATPase
MSERKTLEYPLWEWLEAATATIPSNEDAAALRRELGDHMADIYDDLIAHGWDPQDVSAETLRRMGKASAALATWHRRVGDRRVFSWTLVLIALGLQGVGILGQQQTLWRLAWLLALLALGLQWRPAWATMKGVLTFWQEQAVQVPYWTWAAGLGLGVVMGSEPLWAGQWVDYFWPGWVLPFAAIYGALTIELARRASLQAGRSPVAAAGAASVGLIGGMLAGALAGLATVWIVYTHGYFPLRAVVPNWPWGALHDWVTTKFAAGILLTTGLVLGTSGWIAQKRLKEASKKEQALPPGITRNLF